MNQSHTYTSYIPCFKQIKPPKIH